MTASGKKFESVAMRHGNPNWEQAIHREGTLYLRADDIRSPFERDNGRILHCLAYRRLKHKTQVFFRQTMIIFALLSSTADEI